MTRPVLGGGPAPYLDPALDAGTFESPEGVPHAAIGIVVDPLGRVLLNLRDDDPRIVHPDRWSVLGGLCEPGETALEALLRELEEEAGLRAEHAEPFRRLVDREGRGHMLTAFVVETETPLSALTLAEGQDLGFFTREQMETMDLVPFAGRLLAEFFAERGARAEPPGTV